MGSEEVSNSYAQRKIMRPSINQRHIPSDSKGTEPTKCSMLPFVRLKIKGVVNGNIISDGNSVQKHEPAWPTLLMQR
jgi:hypothetical protein